MKLLILILLFFICAAFISFTFFKPEENNTMNTSAQKTKFESYFTQYNPEFYSNGIVKSSFIHEVKYSRWIWELVKIPYRHKKTCFVIHKAGFLFYKNCITYLFGVGALCNAFINDLASAFSGSSSRTFVKFLIASSLYLSASAALFAFTASFLLS